MLRGFSVRNPSGNTYRFDLEYPERMGVLVKDITGLGPPKANITLQTVYNVDGGRFSAARLEARQLTFELQMIGLSVPSSRRLVYEAFTIKQPVTVCFHTDARDYEARGYVESVTPNIFSNEESVQVVVLCPQPYLTLPGDWENGIQFERRTGGFTFPFDNPVGRADLQFEDILRASSRSIFYPGEAVAGFMLELPMRGNPGLVSVYNHTRNSVLQIDMDAYDKVIGRGSLGSGYILRIDSRPETFGATVKKPNGGVDQVTGYVTTTSVWPRLQPGDNQLEVYTSLSRTDDVFSAVTVYFSSYFMGV